MSTIVALRTSARPRVAAVTFDVSPHGMHFVTLAGYGLLSHAGLAGRFEGNKVEEVEAPRDGHAGAHGRHSAPPNPSSQSDVTLGRAGSRHAG